MIGGALYVTMVGIFALAIGAIVRNTAGGIAAFAAIFFVLPPLMFTLPTSWNNAISQYLPSEAGRQIFALHHAAHTLTPLTGGLVFAAYCAAAIAIAAVLLVRRDVGDELQARRRRPGTRSRHASSDACGRQGSRGHPPLLGGEDSHHRRG